jgi:hypothetical protein
MILRPQYEEELIQICADLLRNPSASIREAAARGDEFRLRALIHEALALADDALSKKIDAQLKSKAELTRREVCNVARPDDPAYLIIPEIALKLLPFFVPKKLRAAVAGDLAEDFRTYGAQWGRPYALRWLWWELAGLCIRRFGPTAIITAIGMWFHQKLGW